ncbi:hypothetical protein AKJ16_DCAP26636 [Drosera capensis]
MFLERGSVPELRLLVRSVCRGSMTPMRGGKAPVVGMGRRVVKACNLLSTSTNPQPIQSGHSSVLNNLTYQWRRHTPMIEHVKKPA